MRWWRRSASTARRQATAEPGYPSCLSADPRRTQAGGDEKAVYGALIRHGSVLSTSVNPTDGLRFDGAAAGFAGDGAHTRMMPRPGRR